MKKYKQKRQKDDAKIFLSFIPAQLNLKFVTHGAFSTNIGSRTYLLDSSKEK
jgi:hypothetical protein